MRKISRKTFIQTTSMATTGMLVVPQLTSNPKAPIKALVFDAFVIFDPRPILKTVEELFPGQARQLIEVWQSRQFTYQWLRAMGKKYKDFWDVTKDALDFAVAQCELDDREKEKDLIMGTYETIGAWPDVVPALQEIKNNGLKVCFLSNMTASMLQRGIENSKLENFFDLVISTDQKQTYKPSPDAYQMAVEKLRLKKEQILFLPFAGWDMAGAKWFGFPTFWVNRLNSLRENLDASPTGSANNLDELVDFIRNYDKRE